MSSTVLLLLGSPFFVTAILSALFASKPWVKPATVLSCGFASIGVVFVGVSLVYHSGGGANIGAGIMTLLIPVIGIPFSILGFMIGSKMKPKDAVIYSFIMLVSWLLFAVYFVMFA